MYLISIPNLKEIHIGEKVVLLWLKVIVLNQCKEVQYVVEEKYEENWVIFRNTYLINYLANFLQIWYA